MKLLGLLLLAALAVFPSVAQTQVSPEAHARTIIDLLVKKQFEDVVKEFDQKMTAAMTAPALAGAWNTLQSQVGAFQAIIDQRVQNPQGMTAVISGTQFDKAALNTVIVFDAQGKIAGLQFAPRQPASAAPAAPPPGVRFTEEPVTVAAGTEWALPGTLSLPAQSGNVSGLVLVHGSGPNDRDETIGPNKPFRDIAWGLADRGIAVLRYEKRTKQYTARSAQIANPTVKDEVIDDAIAALTLLRSHPRIDPARVYILGHSLGGMLLPRIAAQDASISGLIFMAGGPARKWDDAINDQLDYLSSLGQDVSSVRAGMGSGPKSYLDDLNNYSPSATVKPLTMPMLFLQGERDYQVTLEDLKIWQTALAGHSNVTFKTYPLLNHLLISGSGRITPAEYGQPGKVDGSVIDDMARWIDGAASGPANRARL